MNNQYDDVDEIIDVDGFDDPGYNKFDQPSFRNSDSNLTSDQGKLTGIYEEMTGTQEQGVLKWVYDPKDIFNQFELYLRGIHMNHATGQFEQLYKGYYLDEKNEKVFIPYKLMNDRGINDAMSFFTIYVNKVNSFSRYNTEEVDDAMCHLIFDLHERYIIHSQSEFGIECKDGYIIVNMMYDLIRSGWRQSVGGSSINMLGKTTKTTEVYGQGGGQNKKKPMWKFW